MTGRGCPLPSPMGMHRCTNAPHTGSLMDIPHKRSMHLEDLVQGIPSSLLALVNPKPTQPPSTEGPTKHQGSISSAPGRAEGQL